MPWVYRTVLETKTYWHRHRHNPSKAHRKRDIKKNHGGVILLFTHMLPTVSFLLIMNDRLPDVTIPPILDMQKCDVYV